MQTRKVFIGLAAAGALTLWVGASALADSEQPSSAMLEIQAQALLATTTANIETCAATKLTALAGQAAPSGVNAEAWAGALEAAGNKVDELAESGSNKARALTNAFDGSLDDEDVAAPTPTDTTELQTSLTQLQTQVCAAINAVTVHVPAPKVEPKPTPKPKHHEAKPKPKPEPEDADDDDGSGDR
jgi:hypothetical protein